MTHFSLKRKTENKSKHTEVKATINQKSTINLKGPLSLHINSNKDSSSQEPNPEGLP